MGNALAGKFNPPAIPHLGEVRQNTAAHFLPSSAWQQDPEANRTRSYGPTTTVGEQPGQKRVLS